MSKPSPFDHIKSVWSTKQYMVDNRELFMKEYTPFIVNRGLSNSEVGAIFANEMNKYPHLDPDMQYDFYFHGIPKQKGFIRWVKKDSPENQDDIAMVQELYDVSYNRAIEYLSLINISDLENLRILKGGKLK